MIIPEDLDEFFYFVPNLERAPKGLAAEMILSRATMQISRIAPLLSFYHPT